jgi:nucleoside diphosphate kinase
LYLLGVNAIQLIRNKLGSTDPTKAQEGTIRIDYGHDLMRNGAHASDSVESAERERR